MKNVTQTYDLTPKPVDRIESVLTRMEDALERLELLLADVEGEA